LFPNAQILSSFLKHPKILNSQYCNYDMSEEDERQRMEAEDNNVLPTVDRAPGFGDKIVDIVGMGAIGSYGGAAVAVVALTFIGLTPVGPVAGGFFAANMGAGLTSGSAMAVLQSAAMTGTFVTGGVCAGGATGAVVGKATGGNVTKTCTETAGRACNFLYEGVFRR
jgi:hypothetical protein